MSTTSIPPSLRRLNDAKDDVQCPLVKNRFFYQIPKLLLDLLVAEMGREVFDSNLLDLEYALAEACGDHTSFVGFFHGQLLNTYTHLHPRPLNYPHPGMGWEHFGDPKTMLAKAIEEFEPLLESLAKNQRGFCGWLATNPAFMAEHDQLFAKYREQITKWGIPVLGGAYSRQALIDMGATPEPVEWTPFADAFETFCRRWRLMGFTGPGLMIPPSIQNDILGLRSFENPLVANSAGIHVPDVLPVPNPSSLRRLINHHSPDDASDHLAIWHKLTANENTGKRTIDRYARLFPLQHYWRMLHERHPDALRGNLGKAEAALAIFLTGQETGTDSIHKDLLFARKRLGQKWPRLRQRTKQ